MTGADGVGSPRLCRSAGAARSDASDRIGDHRGVRAGDRAYFCWRLAGVGVGSAAVGQAVIPVPSGVRIWIATGHTDMRRGMRGLALQVQQNFGRDPLAWDLHIFRGRRGDPGKIIWHDGVGMSRYAKRLERGKYIWPSAVDGVIAISASQCFLNGICRPFDDPDYHSLLATKRGAHHFLLWGQRLTDLLYSSRFEEAFALAHSTAS